MDQVFNLDTIFNKYGFPALMVFFFIISLNPSIKMITDLIIDLSKQINSYQNTNLALIHAMYQLKEGNIDVAKNLIESAEAEVEISSGISCEMGDIVSKKNESILSKLSTSASLKGKATKSEEEST